MASTAVATDAYAVIRITGTSMPRRRISRSSPTPSMPGSRRSASTTSNDRCRISVSASCALAKANTL